jgi:hypothetical protein
MKSFNKLLCAATIASISSVASANPIYMDLSEFGLGTANDAAESTLPGGADTLTALFDNFITNAFNPTSTYVDTNGVAGINTGDLVIDTATDISISSLQPLGGFDSEGYGTAGGWSLNLDWDLYGVTAVIPDVVLPGVDNYVGLFNSGTVTLDFEYLDAFGNVISTIDDILTLSVSSSFGSAPTFGQSAIELYGQVTGVKDNVFFNQQGVDFHDIVNDMDPTTNVDMKASSNLTSLFNPPTVPTSGPTQMDVNGTMYDIYTRSTNLGSVDIRTVSEPSTLAILALAIMGFAGFSRKKSS